MIYCLRLVLPAEFGPLAFCENGSITFIYLNKIRYTVKTSKRTFPVSSRKRWRRFSDPPGAPTSFFAMAPPSDLISLPYKSNLLVYCSMSPRPKKKVTSKIVKSEQMVPIMYAHLSTDASYINKNLHVFLGITFFGLTYPSWGKRNVTGGFKKITECVIFKIYSQSFCCSAVCFFSHQFFSTVPN